MLRIAVAVAFVFLYLRLAVTAVFRDRLPTVETVFLILRPVDGLRTVFLTLRTNFLKPMMYILYTTL